MTKRFALFPRLCGADSLLRLDGNWSDEQVRQLVDSHRLALEERHGVQLLRAEIYSGAWHERHLDYELLFGSSMLEALSAVAGSAVTNSKEESNR